MIKNLFIFYVYYKIIHIFIHVKISNTVLKIYILDKT